MPLTPLGPGVWPEEVPKHLDYPQRTLYDNLRLSAQRRPAHPMLRFYGGMLDYATGHQHVLELAAYLQQRCGIKQGDRVLLCVQNSPQFVLGYYAILRADAVVVPINPMLLADELRHVVEDSGARLGIVAQDLLQNITSTQLEDVVVVTYSDYVGEASHSAAQAPEAALAARLKSSQLPDSKQRFHFWMAAVGLHLAPEPALAKPSDHALLPYSSGTTGKPKGCVHPHSTFMATTVMASVWNPTLGDETVVLASLPMFHVTGMQAGMNGPIYGGHTAVVMLRWDRAGAAAIIAQDRVTTWTCITTMAVDFLSQPGIEEVDLSSLKRIGGGGAPMPAAVAEKLKTLTGLDYIEGYGLTETAAPSHMNPVHRPKKQCAGVPTPDADSRIIDPETLQQLGPNQQGEIITCGPQVFYGYWNNPEATEKAFITLDGKRFFRTGDLGYYDDEGYFFITDRLKRMINAAGFKVWPAEIESMMYAHPAIQEACVIAALDERRGETVKAVVIKRANAQEVSADDIMAWCREHMAAYKVPRIVEFASSLPRSGAGKVLWRVLQEQENTKSRLS